MLIFIEVCKKKNWNKCFDNFFFIKKVLELMKTYKKKYDLMNFFIYKKILEFMWTLSRSKVFAWLVTQFDI